MKLWLASYVPGRDWGGPQNLGGASVPGELVTRRVSSLRREAPAIACLAGQSHMIDLRAWLQCDADLVQTFVEHVSVRGLNTQCLAQVTLPPFQPHW